MSSIPPICLWAQRSSAEEASKNVIFLTIEVVDPINTKFELTSTNLKFTADSSDKTTHWDLNIDFFEEIDTENSIKNLENGSHIYLVLRKKIAKDEFWPRLTKEKLKYHYIKTDFDKWVDEDEQDEAAEQDEDLMGGAGAPGGPGGMDFSSLMGGAGGPGGPGGIDFSKMMAGLGGAGGPGGEDFDINQLASQLGQAGEKSEEAEVADEEAEEAEEVPEEESK